ncbi:MULTISPECIES: CheR family methyltransferase [Methylobacterium]|jgi:chemotaxis protein methyltransferase CheR|uniref:Chemotaxis protein methyltransferase n=1 Tax=Methylobacterium brachiatum TaxID=269660 RepID=A0AAJ1TUI3_9HYPH|nr:MULTISPECIES: protein-glutamate O-methyltransferase CheR [Methylobacterium]AYO84771.1 protein-glutamate O-methyltransferase CheR [Methylobacterium brachiatum]EIZ82498.1 CheR-type MCP methyltransferase [Methylobacterium sp. GXF4]MCB4805921.1 protein-glutamate O-methyltransferase CheR [Methylobacterium brachiatum]MDH2313509.1 protein-glutamate O-methyltransferase CheR [Methylobacterium brachiatum]MDQ0547196.1 chemotaxis protein methyltransferase CheR [Methylobacterium brachiatum]
MTELEFEYLRTFLKQRSGLALTAEKRYLVESRLTPVCRRFNLAALGDLIGALKLGQDGAIERAVVEAMTTNETFFFRDRIPFDLFRDTILPEALARNASKRRLRIWCAAASTGQEPYSLAMLLQEAGPKLAGWQVEIVATDLSTEVIEKAKLGLYSHFEVQRGLPVQWLIKYFTQIGEQWQIAQSLRSMVDYRQLNLLHSFTSLGQFDVIYCRNVLIYFDAPTKSDVLARLAAQLAPGGALLLGAAETVIGLTDRLSPNPKQRGLYGHAEPVGRTPEMAAPMRVAAGV